MSTQPTPTLATTAPATSPETDARAGRRRTLITTAIVVAFPVTLWALGVFDYLRDIDQLRAHVATFGIAAPIVWVLAQSFLEGFGVPSTFVVLAAMVLWPAPSALFLCILGSTGGAIIGFWLARALARDWVLRRLPPPARRFEAWVSRHGFVAAFALRGVLFVAPGPAWIMGLSTARFVPCTLGAALGCIPGLYLTVYHGPALVRAFRAAPTWSLALAGGLMIVGTIVVVLRKRRVAA